MGNEMTYRELWNEIMYYGEFDRMPVIHWKGWPETEERWREEGMPEGVNAHEYFGAVPFWYGLGVNDNLYPAFEWETISEGDTTRTERNSDGVIQVVQKNASAVPHYVDFTLKTSEQWPEYKKRLQPDPGRIPADLDERIRKAEESDWPIQIHAASLMGWIRNWMGVENMTMLMFQEPDCFGDMVDTISDLACWCIDQVASRMSMKAHIIHSWEDICGSSGPFVSPTLFDQWVAPGYTKIRNKAEEYGIDLYSIDSDGKVEPLIKHWLDAGVNVMFPLEPGTWKATPEAARKKYGKDLRIVGGFDKLVLERGRDAIDAEIAAHVDLCKEGGFVMMPDHLITPGVPLDDYKYYLDQVRKLRF
ncbi:MAG: uroporphyrinogen decarboxylase family protein [Candidatus Sumerlaeia bacterium]